MGFVTEDCKNRIREANDIVAVVESYNVQLRRAGTTYKALCPFHNEKTPSFNVNPNLQIFKCFGCGVGGDSFKFVQLMERVEFGEAVEILAQRAGVNIEYERGGGAAREEEGPDSKKALLWVNSQACRYFEEMLWDEREGKAGREYLLGRGFTPETLRNWRLGWAPDKYEGLIQRLAQAAGEHKRQSILVAGVGAGVLRRNEERRSVYDAFRGRVMFPILDAQQRPIGFGGRVLNEAESPGAKYINSAEGRLFAKRQLLYGLSYAAKEIGLTGEAVVVEGYTDTIMCHQHGLRNVVATLGTALTNEHIRLLRRYIRRDGRVVALFDSDSAGEKATERAIALFMEEDVPLAVVRIPELKDAGEFLPRFGAEAFRAALAKAEDAFGYALRRAFMGADRSVAVRSGAVERIMELANRCPNAVKLALMRQEVARVAGVPENSLPLPVRRAAEAAPAARPGLNPGRPAPEAKGTGPRPAAASAAAPVPTGEIRRRWEPRLVRYMLAREEWCRQVLHELPPDEFLCSDCARLAGLVRDARDRGESPDPAALARDFLAEDSGDAQAAADILMGEDGPELSEADLAETLARLRQSRLQEMADENRDQLYQSSRSGDRESQEQALLRHVEMQRRLKLRPKGGTSTT